MSSATRRGDPPVPSAIVSESRRTRKPSAASGPVGASGFRLRNDIAECVREPGRRLPATDGVVFRIAQQDHTVGSPHSCPEVPIWETGDDLETDPLPTRARSRLPAERVVFSGASQSSAVCLRRIPPTCRKVWQCSTKRKLPRKAKFHRNSREATWRSSARAAVPP